MKGIFLIATLLLCISAAAQHANFNGTWEGKLNVGVELRIVLHISDSTGKILTTMDSPDQSAFGLVADRTEIKGDSIFISLSKYKVSVAAQKTSDTTLSGNFIQTAAVPLRLKKVDKVSVVVKPQTPLPPFPYDSEEISVASALGVVLAGTITKPRKPADLEYIKEPVYPAVILISGSGPQNRDEEILRHKPFAVLADMLTRQGFIVLRYDDRGVSKSTGNFAASSSKDFADDVNALLNYLRKRKDVDTAKLGLLGHSEGAMIASMVAATRNDIDFLILLAGPGIRPLDLMVEQNIAILKTQGLPDKALPEYGKLYKNISLAIINSTDSITALKNAGMALNKWMATTDKDVAAVLGLGTEMQRNEYVRSMTETVYSPWFRYFFKFDPAPFLQKLKGNVLVLNGDKDIQVLPVSNLSGMDAALKKSKATFQIHKVEGVNHLFQTCKKCTTTEYGQLDETISPKVLQLISDWLKGI